MDRNEDVLEGELGPSHQFKIYLNIDHLNQGAYTLYITCKDKTITSIRFTK